MSEWIDDKAALATFLAPVEEAIAVTATSLGEEEDPTEEEFSVTLTSVGAENDPKRVFMYGIPSNPGFKEWMKTEAMNTQTEPLLANNTDLFRGVFKINAKGSIAAIHQAQWYTIAEFENNCTYDSQTQLRNQSIEMALEKVKTIFDFYLDEPEDDYETGMYYEALEQNIKEYGLPIIRYIDELIWGGLSDQSAFMALELLGSISDVVTKSIRREIILKCLSHEHAAIRLGAINGIACLEDNDLIPVLEQHIQQDSSEVVLRACERVLQYLAGS